MSQDLLRQAEKVIEELDRLIMEGNISLLHDYEPFMMDENDIRDVEEMIAAGKSGRWEEYFEEQKRQREQERIEENRRKAKKLKKIRVKKEPKKTERVYRQIDKPADYRYSKKEKNEILERYDTLLAKRKSKLQPGSTVSMVGYGLMHRTRTELFENEMYRQMEEAILNNFIWIKNHSGWYRSDL